MRTVRDLLNSKGRDVYAIAPEASVYDALTLPKLYRMYCDDEPAPPGINVFDLHPYTFVDGRPQDLRSEARHVVFRHRGGDHFDGAAGEAELERPERTRAAPVDELLKGSDVHPLGFQVFGQFGINRHTR